MPINCIMANVLNLVKQQFNVDGYIMLSIWAAVSLVSDEATLTWTQSHSSSSCRCTGRSASMCASNLA